MASPPRPQWQHVDGELCWMVDWQAFFNEGMRSRRRLGEMRGFQVVFQVHVRQNGKLVFWDDDGCIIRRNGQIVHADRSAHRLRRHAIEVAAGDRLDIAQWQRFGGWLWGAQISNGHRPADKNAIFLRHLPMVNRRLRQPNGPVLKVFTHGRSPLRTVLAVYSLIINGYIPDGVALFGEHQWSEASSDLFAKLLPFAEVVQTDHFLAHLEEIGGPTLADWARSRWYVMKTCMSVMYPPNECCCMDDDVLILDRLDDALQAFVDNDLVFAPDMDHGRRYLDMWGAELNLSTPLATARFNAGLYWVRSRCKAELVAREALKVKPRQPLWEQGFLAGLFARRPIKAMPTQRYFYPVFDGLPGGPLGYDYSGNPCRFASIHFGALPEKPSDEMAVALVDEILCQQRADGAFHES